MRAINIELKLVGLLLDISKPIKISGAQNKIKLQKKKKCEWIYIDKDVSTPWFL